MAAQTCLVEISRVLVVCVIFESIVKGQDAFVRPLHSEMLLLSAGVSSDEALYLSTETRGYMMSAADMRGWNFNTETPTRPQQISALVMSLDGQN
jgi:hypothetical protein